MKKVSLLVMILGCFLLTNKIKAQTNEELNEKVSTVKDRVDGVDERLTTVENDVAKLKKIKLSGYIQSEFNYYENKALYPSNQFSIRRARLKATYEAADGVKFVLQPDFAPGSLSLKDAYVVLNDHFINEGPLSKTFSFWAGKFNRPNYEVEYSSSQREVAERSLVIRTLYPGERAIGFKLEVAPQNVPLKVQFAIFNGNDGGFNQFADTTGKVASNVIENKDFDGFKDYMARATYSFKFGSFGGLDIGAHAYFGSLRSTANATLHSDYATVDTIKYGDAISKNWFGAEFQFFADILGGMSLKGEYITGKNATLGGTKVGSNVLPNFQNNFAGYYLYLIKNIGTKNQFAFRYDFYDPNTDVTGSDVKVLKYAGSNAKKITPMMTSKSDLAYTTLTFAWNYYFDENIRITLSYAYVMNEKVGKSAAGVSNLTESYTNPDGTTGWINDYSHIFNQNQLTLRLQAKF